MPYFEIPVALLIIFLVDALLRKIVNVFENAAESRREKRKFEAYDLYAELREFSPSQRQEFLKSLPYLERKRYEYAISVWGKYE